MTRWSNRSPLWRLPVEQEVADEMSFHLEMRQREFLEQGHDAVTAKRMAEERFGDRRSYDAECRQQAGGRNRRWRVGQALDELQQDLRYALRQLRRRPMFALTLIGMLTVGLAATTAVAGLVVEALWQPPPFRDAAQLVSVWEAHTARGQAQNVVSPANFLAFREGSPSIDQMAAMITVTANLTGAAAPQRVKTRLVTDGFFDVLGRAPLLGRTFEAEDFIAEATPSMILSHHLWQNRFGGRWDIAGQTVTLDGAEQEVIGVLPADYLLDMGASFTPYGDDPDIYRTLPIVDAWRQPRGRWLMVLGRLAAGATVQQAQAELDVVMARQTELHHDFNAQWAVRVVPLVEHLRAPMRVSLLAFLGAVAVVFLIVCINASNLMVSRTLGRSRELAVRSALGAGGLRIGRQLLVEGALIASIAGFLGWWLARGLHSLARVSLPAELLTVTTRAGVEGAALLWPLALALTFGCVLIFGLLPSLPLVRRLGGLAHSASLGSSRGAARLRAGLVFGQLVLALILLVGAGLMLRTVRGLVDVDPGFEKAGAFSFRVAPARQLEDAQLSAFYDRLFEGLEAQPGVERVGAVSHLPMASAGAATSYMAVDRPQPEAGQAPTADIRVLRGDYLTAMGIPLLAGRELDSRDAAGQEPGSILISDSIASRLWPGESALGRELQIHWGAAGVRRVVGVVADVHHGSLDLAPLDAIYFPQAQERESAMTVVLRLASGSRIDLQTLGPAVRRVVGAIDANLPVFELQPVATVVANSVARQRFLMRILAIFALLALALAAIGVYGVTALSVDQSRREIGLRMALGATPRQLLRLFLGRTARLTAAALLVGAVLAIVLGRSLQSLLYSVAATDATTLAATMGLLAVAALLAALLPARRATRLDPSISLRVDD